MSEENNYIHPAENTMFAYSVKTPRITTFKLALATKDCPYMEAIFDPFQKVLAIALPFKETGVHMFEKLDDNGEPILKKKDKITDPNKPYRMERRQAESYRDFQLTDVDEIKDFCNKVAVNSAAFDFDDIIDNPAKLPGVPEGAPLLADIKMSDLPQMQNKDEQNKTEEKGIESPTES